MSATTPMAHGTAARAQAPLAVSLEEGLLRTDVRLEAALALLRRAPLALLRWLVFPKRAPIVAHARSSGVDLDPDLLPLEPQLVDYLCAQHRQGRRLILYARDRDLGLAIADRLKIFESVCDQPNFEHERSERAAAHFALVTRARARPPEEPLPQELVVSGKKTPAWVGALPIEALPSPASAGIGCWLQALRLHQWAKNLLVLLPVVLAGPLASAFDWIRALVAFLAMGLTASAGYFVNDLLDLEADRRHPIKRNRPFASGALPLMAGIAAVPILLLGALALAALLPTRFTLALGAYLGLTLSYSFWLKRVAIVDVVGLGGLFTLRVIAGAFAITAPLSYWLLTFSMFLFLSLAALKRYAELDRLAKTGGTILVDRGYSTLDLPLLVSLGVASGIASTVIFVVYLVNEQFPRALYTKPGWLWLAFPILLTWLLRAWRLAVHGKMDEDPVLFALRDPLSRAMAVMVLGTLILAW